MSMLRKPRITLNIPARGGALMGCCLLAASASAPVLGQESQTASDILVQEVVVSARKREESAQTVPISIAAFTNQTLEARGVTQIDQIAAFTPNLVYQNNASFGGSNNSAAIFIRGIGQPDFLGSIEPGVGLYVDGVYIARSLGAIVDLLDVDRVEVLRGPQGTLFGRNTIGGAVSIVSKKPEPGFAGRASVVYGNDDRVEFKGMLNVPLSDTVFLRGAASRAKRDGYVTNTLTGADYGNKDTLAGQLQLRWRPSDELAIDVAFDTTRDRGNGVAAVLRGADLSSRSFDPQNLPYIPPRAASPFAVDAPLPALPPPGGSVPGAVGSIASASVPFLPPGVSPAGPYYELNVEQVPGAPPGTLAPFDVPTDNFTLLSNYVATFLGGQPCLSGAFEPYDPAPANTNPACFNGRYFEQSLGKNRVAGGLPAYSNSDIWGTSVTVDWNLSAVEVVAISAYRHLLSDFQRDFDGTPLLIAHFTDRFEQWQASQEVQLKGAAFDDRLKWILGGYYFKEKVDNLNNVAFTPVTVLSGGLIDNESEAFFAQGTFNATERFAITAGARYTRDSKTFEAGPYQVITQTRTPAFVVGTLTLPKDPGRLKSTATTPYVNLAYRWTPQFMTYVSYSEGFKSGGFTQRVFPPLPAVPSVGPEFVAVYEGGFKWQTAGQRLRLNAAVFNTDYTDIQVQGFTVATGVAPIYVNGSSARMRGGEIELQASPPGGWFVEGGVGYLDDEYRDLPAGVIGLDASKHFERVSKWTLSSALQKSFSLGAGRGTLTPRLDWSYRSKFYNDSANLEAIAQPGYSLLNANVAWASAAGRWNVTAGLENVADKDYILAAAHNPNVGTYTVVPARGREWYLRAQVGF
jgi:iron complex outermembrane recepter protein